MAWKEGARVILKSYLNYHIDVMIENDVDGKTWRFTSFYGSPYAQSRRNTWDLLRDLNRE